MIGGQAGQSSPDHDVAASAPSLGRTSAASRAQSTTDRPPLPGPANRSHRPASRETAPTRPERSAGPIIEWNESAMSTGVDSVDSQHQELIKRINDLHAACLAGTAREELLKSLHFLGNYAQTHFAHEEGIMQQHQCPARGRNKAAHVQFLQDYQKLLETVRREGATTSAVLQLREMLGNWLTNHICSIDTGLRTCAATCPVEVPA